jgi:hypothetical protein
MLHRLSLAVLGSLALSLGACAGPGPGLTGNDTGGIIPWTPDARYYAPDWAAEHCARYGKFAVKTAEVRGYGNYISFRCTWNPRRR